MSQTSIGNSDRDSNESHGSDGEGNKTLDGQSGKGSAKGNDKAAADKDLMDKAGPDVPSTRSSGCPTDAHELACPNAG